MIRPLLKEPHHAIGYFDVGSLLQSFNLFCLLKPAYMNVPPERIN